MHQHPVFPNISLHTDEELAQKFDLNVLERETIHTWPLSCVQKIVLANGDKLAYKSQLPPTVEPSFYQSVTSMLLPGYWYLERLGNCETMVIEWVDAPLLCDSVRSAAELADHGKKIVSEIGALNNSAPVYINIGTAEKWQGVVQVTVEKLEKLVADKRFRTIGSSAIDYLKMWTEKVTAMITANPKIIHGDLKADQVFVTTRGYKVIDWQRPMIAPSEIDLVSLLVGQQIDPRLFVDPVYVKAFWFLRLHWAVEAQFDLFPERRWPLFDNWAKEAMLQMRA